MDNTKPELEKTWLIFGCNGQDGSIMCNYLLNKGYTNIHGVIRRSSNFNTQRLDSIFDKLKLHYGDLTDAISTLNVINETRPDYILNFAAQSHVKVSSELENYTFQTNTIGVLNILQSVKTLKMVEKTRIYQAGTSEEFGNATDGNTLLNEDSKKVPVSIYGISKLAAENICDMYKEAYGIFIVCSTLFNHESSQRGHTFVTQKICDYVKKTRNDNNQSVNPLELGNLYSKRDWGSAHDYMEAVYLMITYSRPENFVISTGKAYSVKDFVNLAFEMISIKIEWQGTGLDEVGKDSKTGKTLIKINPRYYRDLEINYLVGDSSKAKKLLNLESNKTFKQLVKEMVD
jgi:GDPmannose 4,6-dehydratase